MATEALQQQWTVEELNGYLDERGGKTSEDLNSVYENSGLAETRSFRDFLRLHCYFASMTVFDADDLWRGNQLKRIVQRAELIREEPEQQQPEPVKRKKGLQCASPQEEQSQEEQLQEQIEQQQQEEEQQSQQHQHQRNSEDNPMGLSDDQPTNEFPLDSSEKAKVPLPSSTNTDDAGAVEIEEEETPMVVYWSSDYNNTKNTSSSSSSSTSSSTSSSSSNGRGREGDLRDAEKEMEFEGEGKVEVKALETDKGMTAGQATTTSSFPSSSSSSSSSAMEVEGQELVQESAPAPAPGQGPAVGLVQGISPFVAGNNVRIIRTPHVNQRGLAHLEGAVGMVTGGLLGWVGWYKVITYTHTPTHHTYNTITFGTQPIESSSYTLSIHPLTHTLLITPY